MAISSLRCNTSRYRGLEYCPSQRTAGSARWGICRVTMTLHLLRWTCRAQTVACDVIQPAAV